MEFIEGSTKHKFIPNSVISFSNIQKINTKLENDSFIKYEAIAEVKGEYIICNNISKLKKYSKKLVKETYDEYLDFISKRDVEIDRWIYNIIDGISEQDKIIYCETEFILIPSYTWNSLNIEKLHILCIPTDISLRSIRDLTRVHVPLLEYMKKVSLQNINEIYGIKEEFLKIFFHYDPSTYHLHIHFINTEYIDSWSSVEYSHDIDSVIFNLKLDSDYYKKIILKKRV
jgi:m7GpppX diphosphatase